MLLATHSSLQLPADAVQPQPVGGSQGAADEGPCGPAGAGAEAPQTTGAAALPEPAAMATTTVVAAAAGAPPAASPLDDAAAAATEAVPANGAGSVLMEEQQVEADGAGQPGAASPATTAAGSCFGTGDGAPVSGTASDAAKLEAAYEAAAARAMENKARRGAQAHGAPVSVPGGGVGAYGSPDGNVDTAAGNAGNAAGISADTGYGSRGDHGDGSGCEDGDGAGGAGERPELQAQGLSVGGRTSHKGTNGQGLSLSAVCVCVRACVRKHGPQMGPRACLTSALSNLTLCAHSSMHAL